jgi:hypothetical protein
MNDAITKLADAMKLAPAETKRALARLATSLSNVEVTVTVNQLAVCRPQTLALLARAAALMRRVKDQAADLPAIQEYQARCAELIKIDAEIKRIAAEPMPRHPAARIEVRG